MIYFEKFKQIDWPQGIPNYLTISRIAIIPVIVAEEITGRFIYTSHGLLLPFIFMPALLIFLMVTLQDSGNKPVILDASLIPSPINF